MDPSGYCHRKLAVQAPFAAALSGTVGSAKQRPPDCLLPERPSSGSALRILSACALSHPQNRTGRSSFPRLTKTASVAPLTFSLTFPWRLAFGSLRCFRPLRLPSSPLSNLQSPLFSQDQALDRLVSSSSIRCRTSTDDLSTLSSSRGLTCLRSGNSLLWGGFTLRCLQRLSRPHFASLLCTWQYNSCTRGASIPVLSY